MSFKSITERKTKNDTEDINAYMKDYRLKHKEHLQNLEKCKYYKKKGLPQDLIDKFGEHSGAIFKLIQLFLELKENKPEYSDLIIQELLK